MSIFGSATSRWRGVVLAAWAVGIGALLVLGRYSLFIRAELWPLLLATMLILVLFLLSMIARPKRGGSRIKPAAWIQGAMLLLPLLFMSDLLTGNAASGLNSVALQKRSLGFDAASDSMAIAGDANSASLPPGQATNLAYISRHLHALTGTHVTTIGRVFKDDTLPGDQLVIYRFIVVCCAADAMPVQIIVKSPKTAGFNNDDWVQVGGILQWEDVAGTSTPVIVADQVDQIPPLDEPYISPYQF
jgi:putative membrane protein